MSFKNILIGAAFLLAGCLKDTPDGSHVKVGEISESAAYSSKTSYFASLSQYQICSHAIQVEASGSSVSPFVISAGDVNLLHRHQEVSGENQNAGIAMNELRSRYRTERFRVCPKEEVFLLARPRVRVVKNKRMEFLVFSQKVARLGANPRNTPRGCKTGTG